MITISPINNYNTNFKAYINVIKDKRGHVLNSSETRFFRYDLDFDYLVNFLENKYKNVDKVNIIAHACSDGEEIYSFVSKMLDMLGDKKSQKYFPIVAKDIEQSHINKALNGEYKIESFEKGAIDFYLGSRFNNYFHSIGQNTVKPSSELAKHINFAKSNIMDDIKNIDFDNTVLLARNFWHYMADEDVDKLALNLAFKMNKSSTLVIGDFDKQFNIDRLLKFYGFKETSVDNVFEKVK